MKTLKEIVDGYGPFYLETLGQLKAFVIALEEAGVSPDTEIEDIRVKNGNHNSCCVSVVEFEDEAGTSESLYIGN